MQSRYLQKAIDGAAGVQISLRSRALFCSRGYIRGLPYDVTQTCQVD